MSRDQLADWLLERGNPETAKSAEDLLDREVRTIEEVFPSAIQEQAGDELITLESRHAVPLDLPTRDQIRALLDPHLHLLYGIGPVLRRRLMEDGYTSLQSLQSHPRWGLHAHELLSAWGRALDPTAVCSTLSTWLAASDPLHLAALGLIPRERILFFDLETLGFSNAPAFLVACGRPDTSGLQIQQFLATSPAGEKTLLERFAVELDRTSALVSYNGKAFDWTFLRERFAYYGLHLPSIAIHVDLLHHVRGRFRRSLADARLSTVEREVLSMERTDDLPSDLVPQFYAMYLETGDAIPLRPVVDHNRQDLVSLADLLAHLLREKTDSHVE